LQQSNFVHPFKDIISIDEMDQFELETTTNQKCVVHLYDTNGYGDFINNDGTVQKIKHFLTKKHYQWLDIPGQESTDDVISVNGISTISLDSILILSFFLSFFAFF
jgi:hypothetical protein